MDGILIIDKPMGLTSHDVVARVRRAARQRKVGHAGTLDPLATGVLVLALGKATRTIEYLTAHTKRYAAQVQLGQSTTTYDAEGEITAHYAGPLPTQEEVEEALVAFQGNIMQKPPLFSAIKKGGEALYKKARRGESVEIAPRSITIYDLILTQWTPSQLHLTIHCSKGTYIRSLAHDLGTTLGTGGHLSALRRTASGTFTLADAHALDSITRATRDEIDTFLLPVGVGLDALPAITVGAATIAILKHGRPLPNHLAPQPSTRLRVLDEMGRLIAILTWRSDKQHWQPKKVFV